MFNPIRRNRKIGKTQGGRVRDGKPVEKRSRVFTQDIWTRLSEAPHRGFIIIRENPSRDYFHPLTENDVRSALSRLPQRILRPLKAVVLSRLSARDARHGVEARRRYQCVVLYAFPRSMEMVWPGTTCSDAARRHYEPWCSAWSVRDDSTILTWTADQAKRYYLCFTYSFTRLAISINPSSMLSSDAKATRRTLRWNGRGSGGSYRDSCMNCLKVGSAPGNNGYN